MYLCIKQWFQFDACLSRHGRMKILNCMPWWNALDNAFGGWVWSKFHHSSLRSSWWNIDQTQPPHALSRAFHHGIQFNIPSFIPWTVPIKRYISWIKQSSDWSSKLINTEVNLHLSDKHRYEQTRTDSFTQVTADKSWSSSDPDPLIQMDIRTDCCLRCLAVLYIQKFWPERPSTL